jgi:hypothetical protein
MICVLIQNIGFYPTPALPEGEGAETGKFLFIMVWFASPAKSEILFLALPCIV